MDRLIEIDRWMDNFFVRGGNFKNIIIIIIITPLFASHLNKPMTVDMRIVFFVSTKSVDIFSIEILFITQCDFYNR